MDLIKSTTYSERLEKSVNDNTALFDKFKGASVMITGASGMIGSFIVDLLMCANRMLDIDCKVTATGRNINKLNSRFEAYNGNALFCSVSHDVTHPFCVLKTIDYIIHAASNADPASFANYPADTMLANIMGTYNLLEYGRKNGIKRFMFVSSGEFYGSSENIPDGFKENDIGKLDFSTSRICYPEGKRSSEALCKCYEDQYGLDIVIVRPCHVFGPTMTDTDSRALSQFFKSAVLKKNILLKSPGNIERSQCYVADAAIGILTALIYGKKGEAYNVSDNNYVMSIRQFASAIAKASGVHLVFENPADADIWNIVENKRQVLDNTKLIDLGWNITSYDKICETVNILEEALL